MVNLRSNKDKNNKNKKIIKTKNGKWTNIEMSGRSVTSAKNKKNDQIPPVIELSSDSDDGKNKIPNRNIGAQRKKKIVEAVDVAEEDPNDDEVEVVAFSEIVSEGEIEQEADRAKTPLGSSFSGNETLRDDDAGTTTRKRNVDKDVDSDDSYVTFFRLPKRKKQGNGNNKGSDTCEATNDHDSSSHRSISPQPSTSKNFQPLKQHIRKKTDNRNPTVTVTKLRGSGRRRRRAEVIDSSESSTHSSESDTITCEVLDAKSKKKEKNKSKIKSVSKKNLRRSSRISPGKKRKNLDDKEQKKQDAFKQLLERREKLANKPKRESPERGKKVSESEYSDDSDSDSDYTYDSPVPVISESEVESDYNGSSSTPSSSSVTSSGETDEEPDLEIGGSDGEAQLHNDEEEVRNGTGSEEEFEDVNSCSSSSDGEPPDDGQNDDRCILCKNLGSISVEGRAEKAWDLSWCKCGECKHFSPLLHDYDLVCCKEIQAVVDFVEDELEDSTVCITKHPRFEKDVLENEGYARSISKHCEPKRFSGYHWGEFYERYSSGKSDEKRASNAKFSFKMSNDFEKLWKSLSSYSHWIFDKLNEDARQIVVPACVQNKVRRNFNITPTFFKHFKAKFQCPNGRHCRLSS